MKRKPHYMLGYACYEQHCQLRFNDGICSECGNDVREAVCRGAYAPYAGIHVPYDDGFVRWKE